MIYYNNFYADSITLYLMYRKYKGWVIVIVYNSLWHY